MNQLPAYYPQEPGLLDLLTQVLSNISFDNIEAASEQLVNPAPFVLDDMGPDTTSSEHWGHCINLLDSENRGEPRVSKIGQPPIAEDSIAHQRIRKLFGDSQIPHLQRAIVVGEEAGRGAWDAAMEAPQGAMVVSIDPIDGSSNYDSLGHGFSTNMCVYVKTAGGKNYQLVLSMVTGDHHCVVWQIGNKVFVRSRKGRFVQIDEPIAKVPRDGYIAAVAAMAHHRARVAQLMETASDPSWRLPLYETGGRQFHDPAPAVYTMGGAPATIGLAIGRISAAVTTSPQTIHDTAGVPALLALNLPMYDAEGPVDRAALMARFNQLDSPDSQNYTPIPPLVIGRDEKFVALVAERTFHSEPMDLVAVPRRPKFTVFGGGTA
ncbi:hypothetical protein [Mycolicibacterium llatzerense]|uniref:hypothetical protein n=1 Tax=Mycolicibacterium llatzerense TaxID=280871 RepID=UPI0008DE9BFA|nr:hypothetical protein [Mycolicibacterium llatzerense]